ncbi:FxsA family protein [Neisseria sp.]|uniref:FxsA family protein n=1 Tax=Neisseria sp. TaxID=192066 RepID=UPI0026DCA48F|nr:FxsA family protein [Neisseria sp.]MDO4907306.1 FxsA family protein [Neisseria sp.]
MRFFGIGFLVLLFLEIMSIVWVADWLGGGATLALMVLSFIAGVMMLRHTGLSGVLLAGAAMKNGGEISLYQMLWPVRYAVAALLLMSPGFVSLVTALILLLPFKGRPIAQMNTTGGSFGNAGNPFSRPPDGSGDIIEGEYTVTTPSEKQKQDYIEHKPD